jgi:hypothetical protein
MKWIKLLGAALLAVPLVGPLASTALAAEPAFYECHKGAVGSGVYSNKTCSTLAAPGKGKFEVQEGVGGEKLFKGKAGKTTWHVPSLAAVMECKTAASEGIVSTPTEESEVRLSFAGCSFIGKHCTTAGQPLGTVLTEPLKGELGYLNKSKREVGIDFRAETGTQMAKYECEGLERVLFGSLIGSQTGDINTFSTSSTWTFSVNGEGEQVLRSFEGGVEDFPEELVNGSGPFAVGIESSFLNKGEELQIKA